MSVLAEGEEGGVGAEGVVEGREAPVEARTQQRGGHRPDERRPLQAQQTVLGRRWVQQLLVLLRVVARI